ncbi:cytochrome P450 [Scopulibacillus daqui]|uniref:Cytochrome P450 n=1 Tax=Scopulibacillus daqui TaxID=1469162 RepID=A0ABS2PV48_9BACL|nr:cytochrome P450 [Scopulibacillus daqui]MBM7643895.1 cytochrome P450 [Scopulibacillus daqui]
MRIIKGPIEKEERLNPFPWYKKMRQESPVFFNEAQVTWDIFTYDEAIKILRDHDTFSSVRRPEEMEKSSILSMDRPRHTELRGIISRAFTPKAISDLEPRIQEIASELLDSVENQHQMDIVKDLAYPLPVIIIAELLGVPSEDREQFKRWSDLLVEGPRDMNPETIQRLKQRKLQGRMELEEYFAGVIEQRRKEPREDLISALIAAEINGCHLTVQEIINFSILLLAAGNETTTNLITNACRCFLEHPAALNEIQQDFRLIPPALEEVLRYYSPVQATSRIVKQDTEFAGRLLQAGEQVNVWIGSANRDERVFADPEQFDIHRTPHQHLAFGKGIHFCIGAHLARLEAKIAFEALFERFAEFQLVPCELEPIISGFVYGLKALPVEMSKR